MTLPLEVFTGPKPPTYSVRVTGGRGVLLENGRPVDVGRTLSPSEAVTEAVRLSAFRAQMIVTAAIWPARDPQRLPVRTLIIPPAPGGYRSWN